MVNVEIRDYVWERFRLSWALMGIREHKDLVRMLEDDLLDRSNSIIEDSENQLLDEQAPEALARREIGLIKEDAEKRKKPQKTIDQF